MRRAAILIALLSACTTTGRAAPTEDELGLAWLVGCWERERGTELVEECWLPERGGHLFGINRTVEDGKLVFFEFLAVEPGAEGPTYVARPRGGAAVSFAFASSGDQTIEFHNADHDFPNTIRYRRDGQTLRATIEGRAELQRVEWVWTRAAD